MSGGRVTIPNNVRKTIQNIKEITGNHSEDEIYAMLKECSMDPNETAQKLLLQDPFHEVKRKRDRKKENVNKESTEPRWKPGRGNRGGRGNYSRHISNDAGGGRAALSAKENGIINKGAGEGPGANPSIPEGQKQSEVTMSKLEGPLPSKNMAASKTPSPSPGVYLSEKDPILMPSQDSRLPVGTIRREVGSQRTPVDHVQETPLEIKSTASGSLGKAGPGEGHGAGKNLVQPFSIARPSSNYNNRMQQAIGPQKVGPSMEWKPKPTNPVLAQVSDKVSTVPDNTPPPNLDSKDGNHEVEKKLKDTHLLDDEHVFIPNHLHVPEAEKLGFCFGSFGLNKTSEASEEVDGTIEEQNPLPTATTKGEDDDVDLNRPNVPPESLSTEADVASNAGPESKQETSSLPSPGHQYPVVQTSPNLSFGFVPPMIGSQFENNESQPRDASHVPSFLVQQPFDPASYYAQFYRANADTDGRMSPFHSTKYNGNVPVPVPVLSPQEVGNSLMLSTTAPPPIAATQTPGVMQTSIAVTQQALPVFRHLPHYPPNYIPYAPFFSPYYVPPPAIHQFMSNGAFPQQPQSGGGMYPAPPVAASKYPLPQYKPASNTGMPGSYGPYGHGSPPAGSATTAANSTSNEDLGGSQFKETNLYITGQQSEGPGVWIAGPGRDMSGLQASSFYNLPQGGQVTYTPTQANHGTFANIYHPAQPVTTGAVHPLAGPGVDMVGPAASVYQQPQPTQINWPNNY